MSEQEHLKAWAVLVDDVIFAVWLTEKAARSQLEHHEKMGRTNYSVIPVTITPLPSPPEQGEG